MQSCPITIHTVSGSTRTLKVSLTDFNRMRWVISALRCNPAIVAPGATAIVDSTILLRGDMAVPEGCHIVLWDGINSLIELHRAVPALAGRTDLHYRYIGQLPDTDASFPAGAQPLFPLAEPQAGLLSDHSQVRAPLLFGLQSRLRTTVRPFHNRRISRDRHQALVAGGQIVFCGAVRPTAAIMDSFFMGAGLQGLRQQLAFLEGIEWRGRAAVIELQVKQAMVAILSAAPASAADAACLYALVNTLHRLGTLSILSSSTTALLVNEYGYQTHLDPYDALGYRRNLFADFGSTRGPDLCYPRTVDLALTAKPAEQLRLLQPGQTVLNHLNASDTETLWMTCERDAQALLTRQRTMFGN